MKKVLLINDSKFECLIIKDLLNTLGYDTEVGDEYTALKLAKSINPELVIANYVMKEIRGDQLIALIKLQHPNIKCVLSSSNNLTPDEFQSKRIDAVFHTPIEEAQLAQIINKLFVENKTTPIEEKKKVVEDSKAPIPKSQEIVRFCPYCGHNLDSASGSSFAFCPFCGHKM